MNLDNTLMSALGMEILTLKKELVEVKMPVDSRTRQPMGFLHGGASVALAETAASIGGYLNVDSTLQQIFGVEINANHLKSKKDGWVIGKATPIHLGKSTMVWEIKVSDEQNKLICIARCTLGVIAKKTPE